MRNYKIIYCFLDSKGFIENDEDGKEKYYATILKAYNKGEALEKLQQKENFKVQPEIIAVLTLEEEQENGKY